MAALMMNLSAPVVRRAAADALAAMIGAGQNYGDGTKVIFRLIYNDESISYAAPSKSHS